ncbi:Golgin candidate 6 [Vitis vinifera]|uniref:Golgin candidate 6 n=1 Tax=Vitis vinifera TaxID=29760 RepID=A0A438FT81_VITVI|nr:Golgin candidate 6 [Vitis vinifera]
MVGLVFGNENSGSSEDSYVERLLDRISNGALAEDRRTAVAELQSVVAESRAAQLAFGAMGFPILMGVLKEERDDVEMVRGALETLVSALTPIDHGKGPKNEVQPALMNTDLLSREAENISLLLSLLTEEDFYIRYYTLQLLTALLTNLPNRLQEAILTIPRGITRLMDMLMDREVIRNEALLLLTYLTREAEIFSIIKEEGGSEGGVVVQVIHCLAVSFIFDGRFGGNRSDRWFNRSDSGSITFLSNSLDQNPDRLIVGPVGLDCLELLNNLLRNNASNQILLRETMGFDPLISILKLRGSTYSFTQQKTINLLSALETINLLLMGGPEAESAKDANRLLTNKTVLVQKKVLDHLLMLGVESQWAPVAVRCALKDSLAMCKCKQLQTLLKNSRFTFSVVDDRHFKCIGDLIAGYPKNLDALASKVLGEEPHVEPALNSILRIILRTSSVQEFIAADYVFKCFCEKNSDGQTMLASTLIPQPHLMTHASLEEDVNMSFGSMLLRGLTLNENDVILSLVLKQLVFDSCLAICQFGNHQTQSSALLRQLVFDCCPEVTCCRAASVLSYILKNNIQCKERVLRIELEAPMPSLGAPEPLMHRMGEVLGSCISMKNCPNAVHCFLDFTPPPYILLELVSNPSATVCIRGLTAVLLGECVLYNKSSESGKDAFTIVDSISQKVGLTSYFLKFDEMQKSFLFSSAKPAQPRKALTRSNAASMAEIEDVEENDSSNQNEDHPILISTFDAQFSAKEQGGSGASRIRTEEWGKVMEIISSGLKSFVEKQCSEIQDLLGRNANLAEDWPRQVGAVFPNPSRELVVPQSEFRWRHSEEIFKKHLNLSDAYNSLEQANYHLEKEVKALKSGGATPSPDIDAIKAEAREEAQKESEAELNDLLVCLGQEQSKVEKLSARLLELGEDVDKLLEGIGDDMGLPEDSEDEED